MRCAAVAWLRFCAKTNPGILNILVSISAAHQLIDISKFSVTLIMHVKKILPNEIFLFQVGFEPMSLVCVNSCCVTTYTKP